MIRVLIVDDESKLVEAFIMQLTKEGMKVSGVFNAADALSALKKESFDVAVVDIRLPDLDGVNLLLKMKQAEPGTRGDHADRLCIGRHGHPLNEARGI